MHWRTGSREYNKKTRKLIKEQMDDNGDITPKDMTRLYRKDGSSVLVNFQKHFKKSRIYKNLGLQKKFIEYILDNYKGAEDALEQARAEEAEILGEKNDKATKASKRKSKRE